MLNSVWMRSMSTVSGLVKSKERWMPEFIIMQSRSGYVDVILGIVKLLFREKGIGQCLLGDKVWDLL